MKSAFAGYHPAVNFLYFALVMVLGMFLLHPACLLIGLAASLLWLASLRGRKGLGRSLWFMLPLLLGTALLNPLFSHQGVTILAYFPTGNPLTLESICFGIAAAALLGLMMSWFACYNQVMTTDKFIYLFGRVIPSLSLLLSMALRFVPRLARRLKAVTAAQRGIGMDLEQGTLFQRARTGIQMLSALLTWSLEDAVETADSMKSRGYGLKGRTAYALYRMDGRDAHALWWLVGIGTVNFLLWWKGGFAFDYFPALRMAPLNGWSMAALCAYLLLCATPLLIDRWEDRKWKRSALKT